MRKYIPLAFIVLTACNHSVEPKQTQERIHFGYHDNDSTIQPPSMRQRQLPKSEFEITEGGIGKLLLGNPFHSVEQIFPEHDTLTMESEGMAWRAKRIDVGNDEWILVESDKENGNITRLHTNSKKYKTPKGFHVGQTIGEIIKSGEKIGVDIDEGSVSVRLYEENVSVNIDSLSENHFYQSKNQDVNDIPLRAIIVSFGIF